MVATVSATTLRLICHCLVASNTALLSCSQGRLDDDGDGGPRDGPAPPTLRVAHAADAPGLLGNSGRAGGWLYEAGCSWHELHRGALPFRVLDHHIVRPVPSRLSLAVRPIRRQMLAIPMSSIHLARSKARSSLVGVFSHTRLGCFIGRSPLILGLDLRDSAAVDFAWPIITNQPALAVNRAWPVSPDGSGPGRLVATDGAWEAGRINNITKQVWAKNVSATEVAVLFVNVGESPQTLSIAFGDGGGAGMLPAPCTREPCATDVPGWDKSQPLFRWCVRVLPHTTYIRCVNVLPYARACWLSWVPQVLPALRASVHGE